MMKVVFKGAEIIEGKGKKVVVTSSENAVFKSMPLLRVGNIGLFSKVLKNTGLWYKSFKGIASQLLLFS